MVEDSLLSALGQEVLRAADSVVPEILAQLRRSAPTMLAEECAARKGFEERLYQRWKTPFDLYQMVLTSAREIIEDFDRRHREEAVQRQDFTFEVLHRLAVRASRVAAEILCLLRGGFADAAYGRWRTLHEVATVAYFVQEAGGDTAERYLRYEYIEAYKSAVHYQNHAKELGHSPLSHQKMEMLKAQRDTLVGEYGVEFAGENGWAFAAIRKLDPSFTRSRATFDVIEQCAKVAHLRPHYRMASNQVHAGPKGAAFSLGLIGPERVVNLVGASNAGLDEAGRGACASLFQVLSTLLVHKPELDRLAGVRALHSLVAEAAESFAKVQRELQDEERSTVGSDPPEQ